MRINIADKTTGANTSITIDDPKILHCLFYKRLATEVRGELLSPEYQGYIFKITGGNDKQGFPLIQGVQTDRRVRLLFRKGMKCFRERRTGQLKRKSVRGCITTPELSAVNLLVVRKGEKEIEGLTDLIRPNLRGPKRVGKIRKMFKLTPEVDVRQVVISRSFKNKNGKRVTKKPKIQRLITPRVLAHRKRDQMLRQKRHEKAVLSEKRFQELMAHK
eukprot:gnl/Carplike_NY0171/241_a348_5286.p1 GENE.gnl/Carplike_NY0171/241_a348_5286~~gnl/Carplike_NY0171/241_a348_5286.p1  ORF type:complete len:217 (+),score=76.52 gnl/Carplike_NY0171/241_a348_5286:42-692(+)